MNELRSYVEYRNQWRHFYGSKPYRLAFLTKAEGKEILDHLEGDMSPENVYCDGEISVEEGNKRYARLVKIKDQLLEHVPGLRS